MSAKNIYGDLIPAERNSVNLIVCQPLVGRTNINSDLARAMVISIADFEHIFTYFKGKSNADTDIIEKKFLTAVTDCDTVYWINRRMDENWMVCALH